MLRRHCTTCLTDLEPTDWFPEVGLDPALRKLKCPKCGGEDYQVLTEKELIKFNLELDEKARSEKVGG